MKRILGAVFGALVALAAINSEAQAQATGVGITPGSGVSACVFSVTGTLKAPCVVMVDPVSGATIVTTNGTPATSLLGVQGASNGVPLPVSGTFFQTTQPVSLAAPVSVTPKTASFTITGCSVTTSSAQCLAGATAVNHVQIQNTSASASIACNWGGTAILNSAAGSFMLAATVSSLWGPTTSGIPSAALNCIGSAAATLYIEYN